MLIEVEQCILCAFPAMPIAGKEQKINKIKHQVRSIFVLEKLLQISNSTCVELLKNGNPSTWFSYCFECFETVIEAERVYSELVKLTKKWRNLKQCIKGKVVENCNRESEKPETFSKSTAYTGGNIAVRIRKEALQKRPFRNIITSENGEDNDSVEENDCIREKIKVEVASGDDSFSYYENEDDFMNESYYDDEDSVGEDIEREVNLDELTPHFKIKSKDRKYKDNVTRSAEDKGEKRGTASKSGSLNEAFTSEEISEYEKVLKRRILQNKNEDAIDLDATGDYPCNFCPVVSKSLRKRMDHENSLHGQLHLHKCEDCGNEFTSGYTLKQHQFVMHSGLPKYLTGKRPPHKKVLIAETGGAPKTSSDKDSGTKNVVELNPELEKLQCRECFRVFRSEKGRNYHQKRFHAKNEEKPFRCGTCGSGMSSENSLMRHMQHMHKRTLDFEFVCDKCPGGFVTEARLKTHIYSCHKSAEFEYKCSNCSKKFVTAGLLEVHLQSDHPTEASVPSENAFPCSSCYKRFPTLSGRRRHEINTHVSDKGKPYVCNQCDKGFFAWAKFQVHMFKLHNCPPPTTQIDRTKLRLLNKSIENPLPCEQCKLRFPSQSILEWHVKRIHEQIFQCPSCPKKFRSDQIMKHHHKTAHPKDRGCICEQCGKKYSTKLQVKYHVMKEHEQSSELKCKHCGKLCAEPGALKKHIALIHNRAKCKFKCPLCNYVGYYKRSLDSHILRSHTNERPYACTHCDKTYAVSETLKIHLRTHTGEKPYHCKICEKSFIDHRKLNAHTQSLHSTEKQHQCEYCGKSFPSRHYLTIHIYGVHKKKQKDAPTEKILITDELLGEIVNGDGLPKCKENEISSHLRKALREKEAQQNNEQQSST